MTQSRVTLVTGGAGGIGAALCRRLANSGETLFVHTARNRDKAEAVAADARAAGATAHVIVSDFSNPVNGRAVIEEVEARAGRLDALAHLAGRSKGAPFGEAMAEDFDALMATNTASFFHMVTAALPMLHKAERGRVVTAGSAVAHRYPHHPDWFLPATAATRAALVALTRSLAAQLAPVNVTANVVVPGRKGPGPDAPLSPELKSMIPLGRFAAPDEHAAVIAFLLSPEAGYITGQCIHVDGGFTN